MCTLLGGSNSRQKVFSIPDGFKFFLGTTDCDGPDSVFMFHGTNQTAYIHFGAVEGQDLQHSCCIIIKAERESWFDHYCDGGLSKRIICEINTI